MKIRDHLWLRLGIQLIFILILLNACKKDDIEPEETLGDILVELNKIEGFTVTEITPENGSSRQFKIMVEQPLDHNNVSAGKFEQTIYLSFTGYDSPVVFNPNGYAVSPKMKSELSDILNANDIHVGHRYFAGSIPENLNWRYLTIKQAADDHHRIVELLKPIFKEKWISSGGSKSGITVLFHRRFYPEDVIGSFAFVAPVSRELQDTRYVEYIRTLGTEEERNTLKNYQRGLLLRRNELIPKVESYINNSAYTFSLTASQMLESEAFTFSFAYFQYYGEISPEEIPTENSTVQEYYDFFEPAITYLSDEYLDYFRPSYYQRFTEIGDFKPDFEYITDLLIDFPEPHQRFKAPKGVEMVFDPSTVDEIVHWLENDATNIVYIYGAMDPWTAGQVDISNNPNCIKIIAPGKNHLVRIEDLQEKAEIISLLEEWFDTKIN